MTFDREEYLNLTERRRAEQVNGQRTNLEAIRQQAVKGELLTGQEHWDTFLSYLEAAAATLTLELDSSKATLCRADIVDPDVIMRLKVRIAQLETQIGTIRGIMTLPKDLMEQGEKAEKLLDRVNA